MVFLKTSVHYHSFIIFGYKKFHKKNLLEEAKLNILSFIIDYLLYYFAAALFRNKHIRTISYLLYYIFFAGLGRLSVQLSYVTSLNNLII